MEVNVKCGLQKDGISLVRELPQGGPVTNHTLKKNLTVAFQFYLNVKTRLRIEYFYFYFCLLIYVMGVSKWKFYNLNI